MLESSFLYFRIFIKMYVIKLISYSNNKNVILFKLMLNKKLAKILICIDIKQQFKFILKKGSFYL